MDMDWHSISATFAESTDLGGPSSPGEGWIVHGVLEKSSRNKIREHMGSPLEDGVEAIRMFRCGSAPERLVDLASPLKSVKAPTLLGLKEYKDLKLVKDRLDSIEQCLQVYKDQWEEIRLSKIRVDCVELIQELLHRMTGLLQESVGKKLNKVEEDQKLKLVRGPFKKHQLFDRKCGSYLELLLYHAASPNPCFNALLIKVEDQTISMFWEIEHFPKAPKDLRALFLGSFIPARKERDVESHIGMIKDDDRLSRALTKIRDEIQQTQLANVGMRNLVPLIEAGMLTLLRSHTEQEEGAQEKDVNDAQPLAGVKVTFRVKKQCELGSVVHVVGFHKSLGGGNTSKAIAMASFDGQLWWTHITFSLHEQISYRYVVRCLGEDRELSEIYNSAIEDDTCTLESVWD